VGDDPPQLVLGRSDAALAVRPEPDQGAVLADPPRGPPGFGDLVQRQKLRQGLGVELVGLILALGDHPQLSRLGQDNSRRRRFDQLHEPFITGRRLDDRLVGAQLAEVLRDPLFVLTRESLSLDDSSLPAD
jgi:hypothetical protein